MADKITLQDLQALVKTSQAEEAELQTVLQEATKLKGILQQAEAVIQKNQKEFADADE